MSFHSFPLLFLSQMYVTNESTPLSNPKAVTRMAKAKVEVRLATPLYKEETRDIVEERERGGRWKSKEIY